MAVCISLMLAALLGADPAPAAKEAKTKVYVVYVTVVEVDADGNETVLFTPKVQTTGDPAGVTVDHADGRSFEFNCQLAAGGVPPLERPPGATATGPAATANAVPPSSGESRAKPAPAEPTARKADDFFVRTYDVSDLLESTDKLTPAEFEPLIQTLKTVAVPQGWPSQATIRPFISTKSLVIKQNSAGHKAVAAPLAELRPRVAEQVKPVKKN